jgi:hypothetical protein
MACQEQGTAANGTYLSPDSAITTAVAWMQHGEIQESTTWLSFPPYFAALHTGYV